MDCPSQVNRLPHQPGRTARLASAGCVLLSIVVMLAWTWRRCPDPVIDFGREIYLPWRISAGQVLYRDLNHFNGPFAPYFNAAVFEVFGASLRTLKITNATIILLLGMLIWRLILEMTDVWGAAVAGTTFAVVFACGQLSFDASFNFLTPYSHDLTHGVALSLAMLACLWKASQRGAAAWFALGGISYGLVLLTKAEVALAASLCAVAALVTMRILSTKPQARGRLRNLAAFVAFALIPPLLATCLLARAMSWQQAVAGVAGAWQWFGDPRLLRITYFRWLMGIDQPAGNVLNMFIIAGWYGVIVLPGLLLGRLVPATSVRIITITSMSTAVLVASGVGLATFNRPPATLGRPLPLFLAALLGGLVLRLARRPRDAPRIVLPLCFCLFGLALLARMVLRVNLHHYGFALAMPGMMILVASLVSWVGGWSGAAQRARWVPRAAVLGAWAAIMVAMIHSSQQWMSRRTYPVGEGADRFLADQRGQIMEAARRHLLEFAHPTDTMVTIPEGSMLNYLARRVNPTRYQNFMPAEVMMFEESRMLADLRERPPEWIGLVHADTSIFDARFFGRDYGRAIAAWIRDNYHQERTIGARPFVGEEFGVMIMKRKTAGATQAP